MRTFPCNRGRVQLEEVSKIIAPSAGPYLVSTAAVAVENTHNFGGGAIQPLDELTAVGDLCREHGIGYHLDGDPVVERPRRNRCAPRRLWAALRHGQRVLLQGSRGSGRGLDSGNHRFENIARARVLRRAAWWWLAPGRRTRRRLLVRP